MIYSPILDLYSRHERGIHDFFLQFGIILVVHLVDSYARFILRYDTIFLSLFVFVVGYFAAFIIIRRLGMQKLFGGLAKYSLWYNLILAFGSWLIYLIMVRAKFKG